MSGIVGVIRLDATGGFNDTNIAVGVIFADGGALVAIDDDLLAIGGMVGGRGVVAVSDGMVERIGGAYEATFVVVLIDDRRLAGIAGHFLEQVSGRTAANMLIEKGGGGICGRSVGIGALMGTAVAKTITSGLVDNSFVTSQTIICALLGGITWNLVTWWLGLPSSSTHALIGGLCGGPGREYLGLGDRLLFYCGVERARVGRRARARSLQFRARFLRVFSMAL